MTLVFTKEKTEEAMLNKRASGFELTAYCYKAEPIEAQKDLEILFKNATMFRDPSLPLEHLQPADQFRTLFVSKPDNA